MKLLKKLMILISSFLLVFTMFTSESEAAVKKFKDVPNGYWAKKEIDEMVSKGIFKGYPDGTFKPNQTVTRAQAAEMIGKALKINTKNRPNPKFSDVSTKSSAYPYIAALVAEGVFSKSSKFYPNSPLTRAQMAKIFVNAFKLKGTTNKRFTDVSTKYWAYKEINTLVATGITTGKTSTKFDPNGKVTRAQMAVFVKRALDWKAKQTSNQNQLANVQVSPLAQKVVDLVNQERAKKKLPPLKMATDVTKVAQLKAEDLQKNNYFAHVSPVYGDVDTMLGKFNVKFKYAGENIAGGQRTPEEVVTDWMNSPGHRANILDPVYTEIGVGVAIIGDGKQKDPLYYWVQMFITR